MKLRSYLPQQWGTMTRYQRFESLCAMVMMALIALVIIVAIVRVAYGVINGLVLGALNPLEHKVFQEVFGEIVTVMIALEFNHSLHFVAAGKKSILQVKLLLLIAILAVARTFVIMDLEATKPGTMFGLAAMGLAVGIVYWLLHDRDVERPLLVRPQRPETPQKEEEV